MEDKKKLAVLIVNHLKTQLQNGSFSDESLESMEVAVQCIESAYKLNPIESDNVDNNLENIIKEHYEGVVAKGVSINSYKLYILINYNNIYYLCN